jgi:hypothetical protein
LWELRGKDVGDDLSSFVSASVHGVGDDGADGLSSLSISLPVKRAFWPPHMRKRDMVEANELGTGSLNQNKYMSSIWRVDVGSQYFMTCPITA